MSLVLEKYTKGQKKDALQQLRKNRADKEAWLEDNKKRKQENKPIRTLVEYIADEYEGGTDPPPPSSPIRQSEPFTGKPKMFDPREPQPTRLPNVKIPLAKTEEEYKGIKRFREQMAKLNKPEISSRSVTSSIGVKRTANDQNGNAAKKPKVEARTNAAIKDKAKEHSSGAPSESVFLTSLSEHGHASNEQKPTATDALKPAPEATSATTRRKAAAEVPVTTKRTRAGPPTISAEQKGNQTCVPDTNAKATARSLAAVTKRKAEEEQGGSSKRFKSDPLSSAGTVSDGCGVAAALEVNGPTHTHQTAHTKSNRSDIGRRCEKPLKEEVPANSVPKPPAAAIGLVDSPRTDAGDASASLGLAESSAVKDRNRADNADITEKLKASASCDNTRLSDMSADADSITLQAGNKRKRDDETSSAHKRPKLRSSNPENSLYNYRDACFINASLLALHSIPAFAGLANEGNDECNVDSVISTAEMKLALARGRRREKQEDARTKLRYHLRLKAERNELKLSPHFKDIMKLLSASSKSPNRINPFVFQQVSGTLFTGYDDSPMNGETQEDAHEFITKLLDRLREEQPELEIDELLAAQFAEQQVCECGAAKTFTEENYNFNIPEVYRSPSFRVDLGALFAAFLRDQSKFDNYRCEKCGESGKWATKNGWVGKRMTKSPQYFLANIPRGHFQFNGQGMEEVKLTTKIVPPVKKVSFPAADGSRVRYHLVAMIRHHGKSLHRGHYTTIRKIGNQWWHCDDTNRGGVTPLSRAEVGRHEDGCVFLLKKTADGDLDGE